MDGCRILFLIDELEVGGSQRQLLLLGREMRTRGHRVGLAYFRSGNDVLRSEFVAAGFDVFLVEKRRRLDFRFLRDLARLLFRERESALITFNFTANFWTRVMGTLVGARRPVCCVGDLDYIPPGAHLLQAAEWSLSWLSRWVVPNSVVTARRLAARRCIPRSKLIVIGNAIDAGSFSPRAEARARLEAIVGVPLRGPVVGTLARLASVKGLDTLLRAAALVRVRHPGATFVVGGEGDERAPLEALRRDLGLEGTFFLPGNLKSEEILAAFDAAALTSVSEGLPNFLVEAIAMGVPAVSTAVGAIPELLEGGRLGLLTPAGDHHAIAAAILDVLDKPWMAAERATAARRKAAAMLTAERLADGFLSLLPEARAA